MAEEEKIIENTEENKEQLSVKTDSLSALTKKINEEEDVDKIKDLTNLFQLAMLKKEIKRTEQRSDMLDYALNEVQARLITGAIEDKDLAKYITVLQDGIKDTRKMTTTEELAPINITQVNINTEEDSGLTREERENVLQFLQSILTQNKENDIIDVESQERNEND